MSKVYEIVQKRVLERLEESIKGNKKFEWVKPWKGSGVPMNFVTKKPYRGINLILLPMGGYYLTMKQINELGGKVIDGQKANMVCYWTYIKPKGKDISKKAEEEAVAISEDDTTIKKIPVFKYYNVFHQSQIEGIDFPQVMNEEHELDLNSEEMFVYYGKEVKINVLKGIDKAYYSPSKDEIVVPHNSQFLNVNDYYGTIMHEMIHSTGHKSRLNRIASTFKFGDDNYSKEELVAEIGSSILRAYMGILDDSVDNNSIAYLKGWYEQIKNGEINEITYASQQAQKAVNFILEKTQLIREENTLDAIS